MREMFCQKSKYLETIRLAIPLIMASSGTTVMQFVDGVFLARHSPLDLAAAGSAGMLSWLCITVLFGTVNYTTSMVANLYGAGKMERIGATVWQGLYLALMGGCLTAILSFFCSPIFRAFGHEPQLVAHEATYLRISLCGTFWFLAQAALSGFFSGRGDNTRVMVAQVSGQAFNIVGDYVLIFGKFGFPEWGIAGAAIATVGGSFVTALILFAMMATRRNRDKYATLRAWRPVPALLRRLCAFGLPNGASYAVDGIIWTVFMMLMGHIGSAELAATTICFRMNSIALMPVIGLGHALGTLVGQCHGRGDDDEAMRYTGHGAVLCFTWMVTAAATFVLFPGFYSGLFVDEGLENGARVAELVHVFIRFVALYCTVDSLNVSLCSAIGSVGDTAFSFKVIGSFSFCFTLALVGLTLAGVSNAYLFWGLVTLYVMLLPIFWYARLRSGRWKGRVVAG